jgi:hypothetical protein
MHPDTLDALKEAYAQMLREPPTKWRIGHQAFYCHMRDVIADASSQPSEFVQETMEHFIAIKPRNVV